MSEDKQDIKLKKKEKDKYISDDVKIDEREICNMDEIDKLYAKKCGNNKRQLNVELENRLELSKNPNEDPFLYPILDDPHFNIKIAQKKEFSDTKYDGNIYDIETYSKILSQAEYELLPQQAFVKNFLSFQTPYNSLLLFHGLGSGKTCSAIGVCEEMRDYLKQMGINRRIIIVASPNVQDNFKLQLFDERKLKEVDGVWTIKGCLGNKMLKEINPTRMKGLKREKVIQLVKNLINASYSFQGYVQFSNEIVKKSGRSDDKLETKIKNLEYAYSNTAIVIDEVHNIRISDDNENKDVAKNLMFLVSAASNIRLLLLSATPMFNSYKEIVWLLNLMNMNDRRGILSVSDVFDKSGNWKKDKDGKEIGKEMFIRKATGYISYVRGENPYTFPFRVYPDRFAPDHIFKNIHEYPKYQLNGTKIDDSKKIQKLSLFLTKIGDYQHLGYTYIIDRLRSREQGTKMTRKGTSRKVAAFSALQSFGYTDLQIPIEALNIIYPYDGLEELVEDILPFEYIEQPEEENVVIDPNYNPDKPEKGIIEEIDEVFQDGPQIVKQSASIQRSEIESEPAVTEGLEGDITMINKVVEADTRQLKTVKPVAAKKMASNTIFDIIDKDNDEDEREPTAVISKSFKGSLVLKQKKEKQKPSNKKGGDPETLLIDPKELTGSQGLKRIMDYVDTKTPSFKGHFEYKENSPRVFQKDEIGKYSAKIKNICNSIYNEDTKKVADGIILIYSSYIDAGVIPMALALEEMGFTRYGEKAKPLFKKPPVPIVDVRTMKAPPLNTKDFKPARYVMITGDSRISPNNDADVKSITNNDNIFKQDDKGNIIDISGEIIKVVIISQAGSEGLDFRALRQVHILEPWYNVNRIEQIIGRAVRNFSHKDLPFSKRNVEIFLYGTILKNTKEEAADLYVYRISELKAIKIGKVTRLLKQTAVDCIINHDQTQFTSTNFEKIEENKNITQVLSDHQTLKNFEVGDRDNSVSCDFMECEFQCLPDITLEDSKLNTDTYNESFMIVNSDKIIQKIKGLMKMRYFYKWDELEKLINIPKKYPTSQIYSALTQIITDNTEYISDKYGRTGYLINIGEYYLFQPSELNYKNISIYDRSVPINYKHDMIKIQIKSDVAKPVIDKRNLVENIKMDDDITKIKITGIEGKKVLDEIFNNYNLVWQTKKVERGTKNWYELCGSLIKKMSKEEIIPGNSEKERLEILEQFLIEHIVDSLMSTEKIDLLNYIYSDDELASKLTDARKQRFFEKIKLQLKTKIVVSKGITGIIIFDGPSRVENVNVFILNENKNWVLAEPEDKKDLEQGIINKYRIKKNVNKYVGFIGFENKRKYMVYKVKDTENKRSTGFRCDQSEKSEIMTMLNDLEIEDKYVTETTKEGKLELCVRQEFTLRSLEYQEQMKADVSKRKTYFLDTETAIMNEFEKKEKPKR